MRARTRAARYLAAFNCLQPPRVDRRKRFLAVTYIENFPSRVSVRIAGASSRYATVDGHHDPVV